MKIHNAILILLISSTIFLLPASAAEISSFKIELSQDAAEIGDIVHLKSTIPIKNSGYVCLFMTGPGLSEKGVPVEGDIRHSRIPYDKVFLNGVTFDKDWDTGLIIGGLQEGEYTLYLSTIEQNALNPREGTYTTAKIKITDSGNKKNKESPIPLSVIIISVISAAAITAKNRE